MSGFDYGRARATATRLIDRFGKPAAILRRTRSGGPDHDPTYTTEAHPCFVVLDRFTAREREGTSIDADDVKVLASAIDIRITSADLFEVDGKRYDIVEPMPVRPADVTVMWQFAART